VTHFHSKISPTRRGSIPTLVRRVLLAFGLPEANDDARFIVTPDVAQAIDTLGIIAANVGEEAALGFARVIGSSTAQMAEALANAMRVGIEMPERERGVPYSEIITQMTGRARDLLPTVWAAVGAVFRRHLVVVSSQRWRPDSARTAVTMTRTVGFVDLVGSTDVLRGLSVAEMAASVNRFEMLTWDLVGRAGGRVVKLIGDEAMFVLEDPIAACRLALSLLAASTQPVRIGLAHGEVVAFHGDFYGPTANLAARLVAVARPGMIVVDESLAAEIDRIVDVEPIQTGPLRGFPDINSAYRVVPP
jgi:adenylate cyclase